MTKITLVLLLRAWLGGVLWKLWEGFVCKWLLTWWV
jgi:hypothetical protein